MTAISLQLEIKNRLIDLLVFSLTATKDNKFPKTPKIIVDTQEHKHILPLLKIKGENQKRFYWFLSKSAK